MVFDIKKRAVRGGPLPKTNNYENKQNLYSRSLGCREKNFTFKFNANINQVETLKS
jgi:hypothetical protein